MACCSRGLDQLCKRYQREVQDVRHMYRLTLCMHKVALQAGRLEDPGDVAWPDLQRLLQLARTSTPAQLMRTKDCFVQRGLARAESEDSWARDIGRRLWEGYLWIVLKLLPDTI